MKITTFPALSDNYMYLVVDENTKDAAVVDPYDAEAIKQAVENEQLNLTTVLTTHHHWDHAGGNSDLISKMSDKNITVVGGDDRVNSISKKVQHGDVLNIGGLTITCLHTPCHTTGHISYYVTSPNSIAPAVFTGDTLFIAGCGRFFEGTAEMMYKSLIEVLGGLPDNTQVYCGHEYTVDNLKFALQVEPENSDLKARMNWAISARANQQPTVPSTIGDEKKTNPFMRVNERNVQKNVGEDNAISAMKKIRESKDNFVP